MPHVPTAPAGVRFWARLDSFHCECPACGQVLIARRESRRQIPKIKRRSIQYDPIASRLTCPACRRVFGVGLLLWPLRAGGRSSMHKIPADHKPTRRQLRQLAQYSYGIWTTEIKRQGEALNLAIDAECTCPELDGGWRESCPVHGWARWEEEQRQIPDPPPLVLPDDDEPDEPDEPKS